MARNRHFFGRHWTPAVALGVTLAVLGGCAAAPAATDSDVATSVPTAAGDPTDSSAPSPVATATESATPTIAADVDLATLLPTTLGGAPASIARFDGENLTEVPRPENQVTDQDPIGSNFGIGGIAALAEELDLAPADVEGAMAYAPDHEPGSSPHAVIAVRVAGADPAGIIDALSVAIGGMQFLSGELTVTEETVGGKTVSVIERSDDSTYFYAIGDVAFIAQIADPNEAEDVMEDLP